ncbi:methylated-DNA--[protein]-cysteine S-methyltransferase [Propionispora hippei]|uniref:Methylated-DNA--protein-cysteine methyltransferase n=1 Tax=Propionispora hippei DSM 15287 TaxID=1123003 RepID=A0A1M6G0X2_9FIRM|nr:methylated-DNA--[protein]-cysteine S-methyltransferase [Propionispora hippei]SHJ03502.1 methylated-DNA-[protein]-cysteine S-methyltransferase [Propionispora hippei DSM 15287]
MFIYFYQTAIGKIGIAEQNEQITNLYFNDERWPDDRKICETAILQEAARQLDEYLTGRLTAFSLPLEPAGTVFMKQVWNSLCQIPYGQTVSYKSIAAKIGKPGAARAVGLANNRNPIPLFIPCHRVIGTNGALVGYRGGLALKDQLLKLETGQCGFLNTDKKKSNI